MLSELKPMSIIFRAKFSQGHGFPLPHQPHSSPQINSSTKSVHSGRKWVWEPPTYPRVGDPSLGVFEGREEPHGQVVSHVQQLVVVALNRHVAKGLPGVGYYSVGREKAPQDPTDRENRRIKTMLAVQSGSEWQQQARILYGLSTAWIRGAELTGPLIFLLAPDREQSIASYAHYWKGEGDPSESTKNNPLLAITVFGHRHHLITREWPHHITF